jgi:CRISPR-associated protein Cmr2
MSSVKYDALIEINVDKVENLNQYISYCKYYFKPKSERKIEGYLFKDNNHGIDRSKVGSLKKDFPFVLSNEVYKSELEREEPKKLNGELFIFLKKYKSNETTKDFPVTWLKEKIIKDDIQLKRLKAFCMRKFLKKFKKIIKIHQ